MYEFEQQANNLGYHLVAGCDEAGRGPLAGPLVCAAVILNPLDNIDGLYDSKGLSAKKRLALFDEIKSRALSYQIVFIDVVTVDKMNVYQASKAGMINALKGLNIQPDYVLTDAMPLGNFSVPHQAIIKGDQLSASIAAASILAKVSRDHYMEKLHDRYPEYGFNRHKGYPTKMHLKAINDYGITLEHRKSFKPVQAVLERQLQLKLK
ncbi:MAG: ribonuclease HII [Candidatus Izemoplasmataceae bacterium]